MLTEEELNRLDFTNMTEEEKTAVAQSIPFSIIEKHALTHPPMTEEELSEYCYYTPESDFEG